MPNETEIAALHDAIDQAVAAVAAAHDDLRFIAEATFRLGAVDYFVETAGDLGDIAAPATRAVAFARDTEHLWRFDGDEWEDLGDPPTAKKAVQASIEAKAARDEAVEAALSAPDVLAARAEVVPLAEAAIEAAGAVEEQSAAAALDAAAAEAARAAAVAAKETAVSSASASATSADRAESARDVAVAAEAMARAYGAITFDTAADFFASEEIGASFVGCVVASRDGCAWRIVAAADGDFKHPATGAGVEVSGRDGWITPLHFPGCPSGKWSDTSDAAPAMRAAIAAAKKRWDAGAPTHVRLAAEAGSFFVSSASGDGLPVFLVDRPILIDLNGAVIVAAEDVDDAVVFDFKNVGFANESHADQYPPHGDAAFNKISDFRARGGVFNGLITGVRSVTQHAIRFVGNVDCFMARDLDISYFNGRGLWLGFPDTATNMRGQVRESFFDNIRLRNCGKTDGTAALSIIKTASTGGVSADASNMLYFGRIEIIYPYGRGCEIIGGGYGSTPIYGLHFASLMLHGRTDADFQIEDGIDTQGALLHIEGSVVNVRGWVDVAVQKGADFPSIHIKASEDGAVPTGISLDVSMPNSGQGVLVDEGQNINIMFRQAFTSDYLLKTGQNMGGTLNVECTGTSHLLWLNQAVTLSAGGSATLNLSSVVGAESWLLNSESINCCFMGHPGVLTGSADALGSCVFTPTASNVAGSWPAQVTTLSKIVIPNSKRELVTGEWGGLKISRRRQSMVSLQDAQALQGDRMYWRSTPTRYAYAQVQSDSLVFGTTNNTGAESNLLQIVVGDATPRVYFPSGAWMVGTWQNPLRLGAACIWYDATTPGVRIKHSAPTSETDGTKIS